MRTYRGTILALVALVAPASAQLSVQDLSTQTPTDLVNEILGAGGIAVSNVSYVGPAGCAGTFTGGTGRVGFETGIILSSGNVASAVGPNSSDVTSGVCSFVGDPDLDQLIVGFATRDSAVLEFDFECETIQFITFEYVFASEEYNEYVNSIFNDVFGFFVNGVNVAMLPDGVTPVAINNVNNGNGIFGSPLPPQNPQFYIDNDCQQTGCAIDIEYDGLTTVLTVSAPVNPGLNHIKLAIADAGDSGLDSAVFIKSNSFICGSTNTAPECSVDLTAARLIFDEPESGCFVVTEDETFVTTITGMDADDGDTLTASFGGNMPATFTQAEVDGNLEVVVEWAPTAADKGAGPFTAEVTFDDGQGGSVACTVKVQEINLRPDCSATVGAGQAVEVECDQPGGASYTLQGSATDADDDDAGLMYHWAVSDLGVVLDDPDSAVASGVFPIGMTMATLTVTDGRGGVEMCDVLVTVVDTTPPAVSCTTSTAALWPPNHKMVDVSIFLVVEDTCQEPGEVSFVLSVSSDEPDNENGLGDGNTTGDVNGIDGYAVPVDIHSSMTFDPSQGENGAWVGTIQLRAERDGTQDGRKYTIHAVAMDAANLETSASCCIVVPHDKRGNNN